MFNLSNTTPNVPRISQVLDPSKGFPPDILQLFTYTWVWFLGGWFFAGVFGTLAAALYMKSQNAMVPVVFLIISIALFGGVLRATPTMGSMPAAEAFVGIIGILAAFAIGFILYNLYRETK